MINQATIKHFGLNLRDKPEEEMIPKLGDKAFKEASRTDLQIDFQTRMKSGEIKSVDGYVDLL